jgi:hypothetical protein
MKTVLLLGAMTAVLLFWTVDMFQQMSNLKSYGFFVVCSILLLDLGPPVLWGSAKARRALPGSLPESLSGMDGFYIARLRRHA